MKGTVCRFRSRVYLACPVLGVAVLLSVLATGCMPFGYVGSETCLSCHNGQQAADMREFRESHHWESGCESCHGPGAFHVRVGGRYGLLIQKPKNMEALCGQCHQTETAEFKQSGHALADVLDCLACHDPHSQSATVRTFTDNQLCLQCHSYQGFGSVAQITDHTYHSYNPEDTGASRCVSCHMVPTDRIHQDGTRSHSLRPVRPIESNLAGIIPAPPNSCSGILGCHDGTVGTAPQFDVDDPQVNELLQILYDYRHGS